MALTVQWNTVEVLMPMRVQVKAKVTFTRIFFLARVQDKTRFSGDFAVTRKWICASK